MAKAARSDRLRTPKFRLSFPSVFEPRAFKEGQKAKYGFMALFDKEAQKTPQFKAMVEAVRKVVQEEWQGKPPKSLKLPFKKGERLQNDITGEYYGGCDEHTVAISVQSDFAPEILNQKKHLLRKGVADEEAQIYAGCYCIATLSFQAVNMPENRCVTVYLGNLMKVGEGESLGGKVSADKDFADVESIEVDDVDIDLNSEDAEETSELDDLPS